MGMRAHEARIFGAYCSDVVCQTARIRIFASTCQILRQTRQSCSSVPSLPMRVWVKASRGRDDPDNPHPILWLTSASKLRSY